MPVYLANGRRVGFVSEVGHAVDYLHVQQGRLLVRDWYIPMTDVRDVTEDGVYLSVTLPDMRSCRRNIPPVEYLARQGATPGYEYTARSGNPAYGDTGPPGPV